jgi:mannonate dehydratase
MFNPCKSAMPRELREHELVRAAWDGVRADQVWDCHVHLIGVGDGGTGVWISPFMRSGWHPIQSTQRWFYQNAGCAEREGSVDAEFLARLVALHGDFARGAKFMLLAFDYYHDEYGRRDLLRSSYYTPNDYVRDTVRRYPHAFEWIASIHPYRDDAVSQLERAARDGARAVKWLPSAMGMDPASPKCDRFYEALVRLKLPLLSHTGGEMAVHGGEADLLNNPLRLRRPLDHGVCVIAAHCASFGEYPDLDRGPNAARISAFTLFSRLMDEPRYQGQLFGEISAMTQANRMGLPLATIISRTDWHARLVNGSDYPLPGVMPLFSLRRFVEEGYLAYSEAEVLSEIRRFNPLLFDYVLKRSLRRGDKKLAPIVFNTRRIFL